MFFGTLRQQEYDNFYERCWYTLTDTCLAFTMFREQLDPSFVACFSFLLFVKSFHWLLEDRVDYMERSPNITLLFNIRVISLQALLGLADMSLIYFSYTKTVSNNNSVHLVFGFEYAVLLILLLSIFLKYCLHLIDIQNENPWENKAMYMIYVELFSALFRCVLYLVFITIITKVVSFPLFCIRPMYLSIRRFKNCFRDIVLSRRAIKNMNTLYPNATAEDLEAISDITCIICREDMVLPEEGDLTAASGTLKKLPCGHIFHTACLRSWFQRQQTCPTCRFDILQSTEGAQTAQPVVNNNAQNRNNQQAAQQQNQQQPPNVPPPAASLLARPFFAQRRRFAQDGRIGEERGGKKDPASEGDTDADRRRSPQLRALSKRRFSKQSRLACRFFPTSRYCVWQR